MPMLKVQVGPEDHIQGNSHAHTTLVEYGDYECGYCGQVYPVIKRLQKYFGNQLRFVFRNFPLAEIHPHAEMAAEAAEFAATQDRFWEMHELIYQNQTQLSLQMLLQLADQLQLSTNELENALRKHSAVPKIKKDFLGGVRSGVNGTPTFFINENRYNGSFEFDSLASAIESVFAK